MLTIDYATRFYNTKYTPHAEKTEVTEFGRTQVRPGAGLP